MKKVKLKKYSTVTTASILAFSLSACSAIEEGSEQFTAVDIPDENESYNVPDDQTAEEFAEDMVAASNVSVYDTDMAAACDEWKEIDDGSFQCIDEDSEYYAQHFFNGLMFATLGSMMASKIYSEHNLKNGERKKQIVNSAVVSPTTTRYPNTNKSKNGVNLQKGTGSGKTSTTSNSYSSGKSGFGSGGASRGGSSSS
ncbi:hypothetical protein [Lysinibacillus sp. K60]|uniref:hypothetical protein n=1 Tax=Lysinibacillus sp. K60 TaxID=2720027 RepID=UPI001C8CE022|nr:hypothetical protein [Lysinibacillus sp. K60]MBX8946027.1 hypothetical protein [Lysinibacillus sp. K60]